ELEIVRTYLPAQIPPEELDGLIRAALQESGASTVNDIGKVMKVLMPKIRGKADGQVVNQRVRELLSSPS
ncbi:MAG: GatB/YqeY domain-containing protein, partial [Chloroflexota bacterium]